MFTGIVEAKSKILSHELNNEILLVKIEKPEGWDLSVGQSIAVNGTCLTVADFDTLSFNAELVQETLNKTTFTINIPELVNLERSMLATNRFEGHIVQGHVDTAGKVVAVAVGSGHHTLTIMYDSKFTNLVVEKGSITIDGTSLTVVSVDSGKLSVALIPHTIKETTLGELKEGDNVNLEFDIVGKYIIKNNS